MKNDFTDRRTITSLTLVFLLTMVVHGQRHSGIIDTAEFAEITLAAFGAVSDQLSTALASGDFNADGLSDMLVGAHLADRDSMTVNSGKAYIVFGSRRFIPIEIRDIGEPEEPQPDVTFIGAEADDVFGKTIIGEDINGDGTDDIIIGLPGADGPSNVRSFAGEVNIFFGGSNLVTGTVRDAAGVQGQGPDIIIYGEDRNDELGASIAIGDINNDGFKDLIVGATGTFGPQNTRARAGSVSIIFGGQRLSQRGVIDLADPIGGADIVIHGAETGDALGFTIAAGDLNRDGIDDIAFSGTNADGPANLRRDAGEVYVLFGRGDLANQPVRDLAGFFGPEVDLTIYGQDISDGFGGSLTIGDISGDGTPDVIVGAVAPVVVPLLPIGADGPDNTRANTGEVYILLGGPALEFDQQRDLAGQTGRPADLTIFGGEVADQFGASLNVREINGDGVNDLIIGAPLADGPNNARQNAGEVYVFFGGSRLFDGLPRDMAGQVGRPADLTLFGPVAGAIFGLTVAIGDIDGDQFNDIFVGAPLMGGPDAQRTSAGGAFVISGS